MSSSRHCSDCVDNGGNSLKNTTELHIRESWYHAVFFSSEEINNIVPCYLSTTHTIKNVWLWRFHIRPPMLGLLLCCTGITLERENVLPKRYQQFITSHMCKWRYWCGTQGLCTRATEHQCAHTHTHARAWQTVKWFLRWRASRTAATEQRGRR